MEGWLLLLFFLGIGASLVTIGLRRRAHLVWFNDEVITEPPHARTSVVPPASGLPGRHMPLTPEQEQAVRARIAELEAQEAQRLLSGPIPDPDQDLPTPPAGVLPTLVRLQQDYPDDPFTIAAGWTRRTGQLAPIAVSLHHDSPQKAGHILLTGETDWGKDGWAFLTSALLCLRNPPDRLQIVWIDGKGPDGALWRGKAHNWHEPITRADAIGPMVPLLEREREQRARLLEQHAVTRWEELPAAIRPPLLWVYVSEVRLLRRALGRDLETWLETELSSARAGGIRYCIGLQNATNLRMEWRSQIGCYIAGGQTSRDGDKPNLNMSTDEIRERGALPPSALPTAGSFTMRRRREVVTVRAPLITLAERKAILARLPNRPAPPVNPAGADAMLADLLTEHPGAPPPASPPQPQPQPQPPHQPQQNGQNGTGVSSAATATAAAAAPPAVAMADDAAALEIGTAPAWVDEVAWICPDNDRRATKGDVMELLRQARTEPAIVKELWQIDGTTGARYKKALEVVATIRAAALLGTLEPAPVAVPDGADAR
jgi:hypothetical protein